MKKEIKIEWCENWIKHTFKKYVINNGGIECNYFWEMAERSGLWTKGTYNTPMSKALAKLTKVETVSNYGQFCYSIFKLI